jgi:RNA polymerase sigma-70 factor (ECF subfamily)
VRDQGLLRRTAAGDREAFAELYDRHGSAVFGLLLRLLGHRGEAEEMLQEVFLEVWRRAARYDPARSAPRTWVLLVARSRAIDLLRSRQARERRENESEAAGGERLDGQPVILPVGLSRLEGEERQRRVTGALARLPPEQREAIELAFFAGLTHGSISQRLDQPLGTVKSRILLGMRKLRHDLEEEDPGVA